MVLLTHYLTTISLISIQLYGHQKIIHIIGPTFCVFVRHRVTAPSFSVRKYVYFVHTILTVYLTILHSFFERQLKEVRRLRRALRRARTASGLINYLIYLTV